MKVFFLLLITFLTTFAQAIERENCLESAQVHGGVNKIADQCFDVLLKPDDFFQKGEYTEIYLTETILWMKKGLEEKVITKIAGDKTQLSSIFSIILDEKNDVAIILKRREKGIDLIVHSLSKDGNVSPFINAQLDGLSDVMTYYYDQESATLFVEELKGVVTRAFRFEWSESMMALGRAKLVEVKTVDEAL